jgi:hypothetical protein
MGSAAGVLFAFLAIEYEDIRPPPRQRELDDAELEDAYQAVVNEDPVTVPEPLRRLAYNDLSDARGCEPSERFPLSRTDRMLALDFLVLVARLERATY